MAENEFSTGSSVPTTTVISIFLLLLLSRARIMRGLLLKRYAYYYHARALCEDCYSKGTPALLKRYAPRYSKGTLITSALHRQNVKNSGSCRDGKQTFDIYLTVYTFQHILKGEGHDNCQ